MATFSKKSELSAFELLSDRELGYLDNLNTKYAHSLFDPLLNGAQTNFFAHQYQNGAPTSGTTSSSLTSVPLISIGPNIAEVDGKTDLSTNTASAYALGVGQSARGYISSLGDHDFYKVTLTAGQTYTFAEIGTGVKALQDPYLSLVNSSGKTVATNDDGGPGSSSLLTYKAPTSGTYYINAGAYGNGSTGEYGLSVTAGAKASFNIEMGAGALDSYKSWTSLDVLPANPVEITYGFRATAPSSYTPPANFSQLSSAEITAVKSILDLWSDVANIKFKQLFAADGSVYTNSATIEVANYSANDGAGAFAYYPDATNEYGGDLWLNLTSINPNAVNPGTYGFFAIMHELGHALGLSHAGDYNAGSGGTITYSGSAQFIQDSEMYSVMSYFGGSYTGEGPGGPSTTTYTDTRPGAFATAYTPMLLDIYEIQQLYGANNTTRIGNTTYGFNVTSDANTSYGMVSDKVPQFCIWDSAGTDTLDCSGYAGSQNISLISGTFSSVDGGTNNVSIALGCTVENAIGGVGADVLKGNSAVNLLVGGGGADSLEGGLGADIFKYLAASDSGGSTLDRILDFSFGDTLDLSVLDANIVTTTNDAFTFIGTNQFSGAAGELRFDKTLGQVQANMDGTGSTIEFAVAVTLIGGVTLNDASFVL